MSKQQVLLIDDSSINSIAQPQTELQYSVLPHPKSANVVYVLVNGEIYECNNYQPRSYASWFIDQRVCSNDSVFIATKIDPRFLLLPFVAKSTKYSPIDQIVTHVAGCDRLVNHITKIAEWRMDEMCDVNDKYDDLIFYRYNEEKALQWLRGKAERCAKVLYVKRTQRLSQGNTRAFANGFNAGAQARSTNEEAAAAAAATPAGETVPKAEATVQFEDEDLRAAGLIVCDYLSEEMGLKFMKHLGIGAGVPIAGEVQRSSSSSSGCGPTATGGETAASRASACAGADDEDGERPKRKLASWEVELEMEKETLAYCSGGSGGGNSSANASAGAGGGSNGAGANEANKKPKTAPAPSSTKKALVAPKGVKSMMSYFGTKA